MTPTCRRCGRPVFWDGGDLAWNSDAGLICVESTSDDDSDALGHDVDEMTVDELVERIRAAFPAVGVETFLGDAGGWIAYYGWPVTDEVAVDAIAVIEREGVR